MSSRDEILKKLRAAPQPYADLPPKPPRSHVVPLHDLSPQALLKRFSEEAKKLLCQVCHAPDEAAAAEYILQVIGEDKRVLTWDLAHIPLSNLGSTLQDRGIEIAPMGDPQVRVGITGATAALAATGSLVMMAGAGKVRSASLLPFTHVAVIKQAQIIPDFESWWVTQRENNLEQFRQASNVTLISGISRTADIAMQMIMGVHGPGEVHVVILP